MDRRKWVKGANGLWSSFDLGIRRAKLRDIAKARIAGIGERFEAVMLRNGWTRGPTARWRKPKLAKSHG